MISSRPRHTDALRRFIVTLPIVCAAVLVGCRTSSEKTPQPVVMVQAEHLERGDIAEHIVADAILSPLAQAAIAPKVTAPVRTFYVQRGSKVRAGQLLAVLENRDLAAQAMDTRGQYFAAQAAYAIQTEAQVPEDYAKAQQDVTQAKAQLDLQKEIAASRKKLFEEGAIAGHDYDTAVAARAQAQAAYDAARNYLDGLQHVGRTASLQAARGQLASAKGKYEAAAAQASYAEIRSPISGVVTDRPLFPGEMAISGTPIVTVMDTSSLLAKVHLSQTLAQQLHVGDAASVFIPGIDVPVAGKVTLISPALDPGSTTIEVWLRIDNRAGTYAAGTPVHVAITGKTAHQVIKVPLSAVLTAEDGSKFVMVVSGDGNARKTDVALGINDGSDVEVSSGLRGTETVITQGAYGLSDGTKVVVGKAGAAESAE